MACQPLHPKDVLASIPSMKYLEDQYEKKLRTEYGQRIFGPIPGTFDDLYYRPRKGSQIFVTHLPNSTYEDTLVPLFSSVGKIYELKLMMELSGFTRGFCFITYENQSSAEKAIIRFHGARIKENIIGVYKSLDNCKLFVSGLPLDKKKEDVMKQLWRVTGLINVTLKTLADGTSKGYGFLEFDTHKNAASARRIMWPTFKLFNKRIEVEWARPDKVFATPKEAKLIVKNLIPQVSKDELLDYVTKYINLRDLKSCIKKYGVTYGYLEFFNYAHATRALELLQGTFWHNNHLALDWAFKHSKSTLKKGIEELLSIDDMDASNKLPILTPTIATTSSITQDFPKLPNLEPTLFSTRQNSSWFPTYDKVTKPNEAISTIAHNGSTESECFVTFSQHSHNHNPMGQQELGSSFFMGTENDFNDLLFNLDLNDDPSDNSNPLLLNNLGYYIPPFFKNHTNPELDDLPLDKLFDKYCEMLPKLPSKKQTPVREVDEEDELLLKSIFGQY